MADDDFGEEQEETEHEAVPRFAICSSTVTDCLDTVFDVLSNAHCRYLLYHVITIESNCTELDTAVNEVCKYELTGTDTNTRPPRETVRTNLQYTHLPRLADMGIIEYNHRQKTIQFSGNPPLEDLVKHVRREELD